MLIAGTIVVLFILGLFFSMLGSGPKTDAEWQIDTEREELSTAAEVEEELPVVTV
jgi:hypothetical protein